DRRVPLNCPAAAPVAIVIVPDLEDRKIVLSANVPAGANGEDRIPADCPRGVPTIVEVQDLEERVALSIDVAGSGEIDHGVASNTAACIIDLHYQRVGVWLRTAGNVA